MNLGKKTEMLIVGTRGSDLALTQARWVAAEARRVEIRGAEPELLARRAYEELIQR